MSDSPTDDWMEDLPLKNRIYFRIWKATPDQILDYWGKYRYYLLLSFLISIVYIIGLVFTPRLIATPTDLIAWTETNSGFISLLLSALLVLLYFGQHQTQRKQERIMERQEKWMEADYITDIFIESWSAKEDTLSISLLNAGNGTAKRFRIRIKVWIGELAKSAPFVDSSFYGVTRIERNLENSEISSSILWPREGPQDFVTDVSFIANVENILEEPSVEMETDSFKERMGQIATASETPVSIQLSLLYEDEREETTERKFWGGKFEVTGGKSLESVINDADDIPVGIQKVEPTNRSST